MFLIINSHSNTKFKLLAQMGLNGLNLGLMNLSRFRLSAGLNLEKIQV